jgi:hypothetical protein
MFRLATFVALQIALLSVAIEPTRAADYGTADEAKAMLERAVAAVNEDKAKALDTFNKGEGGFKDRDLYVFCANTSDGILTAHPYLKGEHLQDIKGKKGYPLGQEIMKNATEGQIKTVTYFGLALEPKRRWRSTPFIRGSALRTAASASTKTEPSAASSRARECACGGPSAPYRVAALPRQRSSRSDPAPAGFGRARRCHVCPASPPSRASVQ